MLLESIKLVNFRQFKDEYIEFAKGQDGKNVTDFLFLPLPLCLPVELA